MKRVAIVQSNYLPWKGYFDLIARSDAFVLLDTVQYTRRDWRNRNLIKTARGSSWISVPVESKGRYRQRIDEVRISSSTWARSHLDRIRAAYRDAPCYGEMKDWVEDLFLEEAARHEMLASLNQALLQSVCDRLGIETQLLRASELPDHSDPTQRLVGICRALGATHYLSGPSAAAYLDSTAFAEAGVELEWMRYPAYRSYEQVHPPFEHGVTILDLLLHVGDEALSYLGPAIQDEAGAS